MTGTCKPVVSPIAHLLTGTVDDGNFVPSVAESGDSLATHRFRKLLGEVGVQVLGKEGAGEVAITQLRWLGLRCRIQVDGECAGMRADLRTKPAMAESSLANGGKPLSEVGKASLVVEDDSAEGMVAVVVVIDAEGAVVSKVTTTVGGESEWNSTHSTN